MAIGSTASHYVSERKKIAKAVEKATGRKTRWVNSQLCYEGVNGSDQTKWERVPKTLTIPKPPVTIRAGADLPEPTNQKKGTTAAERGPSLSDQLAKLDRLT